MHASIFASPTQRMTFGKDVCRVQYMVYQNETFIDSMKDIRHSIDTYVQEIQVGIFHDFIIKSQPRNL